MQNAAQFSVTPSLSPYPLALQRSQPSPRMLTAVEEKLLLALYFIEI